MSSFVAGFMIGVLFAAVWLMRGEVPPSPFSTLSPMEEGKKILSESGAIAVVNQAAGSEVVVESVTVPPPGVWVAVREVSGGDLGNVLGAVRASGPRSSVSIPLLRATEPNLSYAVQLYRDDGDGVFDLATDSAYVDFNTGAPVIARFTTTD